ncbi:MAG: AAA family ATPase [Vicinamibacterales bacterium]
MTSPLTDHILRRLTSTGADAHAWSFVVLAALDGDTALATFLSGAGAPVKPTPQADAAPATNAEPPGAFVGAVTVSGFRGVGPSTTLPLTAGPGLTLVVGRNGSGKSSFAEGLELLLTGDNLRWKGRTQPWKLGWRNLHQPAVTELSAELVVEGHGPLTVTRSWAAGADLPASTPVVKVKGRAAAPLEELRWTQPLVTFRPFLSYNELASMLDEGPSKLYDALSTVLGLDEFVQVQNRLTAARKAIDEQAKGVKGAATALALEAERVGAEHGEPRAVQLAARMKAKTWALPELQALSEGGSAVTREVLDTLRRLAALRPPSLDDVETAVSRLREAARAHEALVGTDAARSLARARLLEQAVAFHDTHLAGDAGGSARHARAACPVCGAGNALGPDWREASLREVAALKSEAAAVQVAEAALASAVREARALVRESGPLPAPSAGELPSLRALREVEARWLVGRTLDGAAALAAHLESLVVDVTEATTRVADEAAAELARREDMWRPLAQRLAEWLPMAAQSERAKARLADVKQAEAWWKETTEAIRNERFAPIAERAMAIWRQLRLQSNVDLGGVELEGSATKRRVTLAVTVDGAPADALGVMSQGELHSLALSLFLPRATLAESPFRFLCVDDPVQSMDPARVEGLARVLAEAANTRQVIVFSHDDRLPEAVRRLGLPARILRVTRRANSVVEVQEARDPVSGHLDDARAVLKTDDLRTDVKARVVPGFCRLALEAACVTAIRTRRLRAGGSHDELDALLAEHVKLYPLMALALFDDATRVGDVLARLKKLADRAPEAFKACNAGAHESFDGDLENLVYDTQKLTSAMLKGAK